MEIFLVALGIALLVTFFHPKGGLILGSIVLFVLAVVMLNVAKGAIHESTAATLAIGAFVCAGLAGVIHHISGLKITGASVNEPQILAPTGAPSPKLATAAIAVAAIVAFAVGLALLNSRNSVASAPPAQTSAGAPLVPQGGTGGQISAPYYPGGGSFNSSPFK